MLKSVTEGHKNLAENQDQIWSEVEASRLHLDATAQVWLDQIEGLERKLQVQKYELREEIEKMGDPPPVQRQDNPRRVVSFSERSSSSLPLSATHPKESEKYNGHEASSNSLVSVGSDGRCEVPGCSTTGSCGAHRSSEDSCSSLAPPPFCQAMPSIAPPLRTLF